MTTARLQIVRRFRSDPRRVYAACTDPALLSRWLGPKEWVVTTLEADVRVGGAFRFTMVGPPGEMSAEGTYEVVEPPHRIVHTWRWSEEQRVSRVIYLVDADGSGTCLTFTHERLENRKSSDSHEQGWSEALEKLDALLSDEPQERSS